MKRGSITLPLALIFPLVLILVLALLESARIAGLNTVSVARGNAAMSSVFAAYNRTLFDEYGLLFFDGGYGSGLTDAKKVSKEYLEAYQAGMPELAEATGSSFLEAKAIRADLMRYVTATDENGAVFIQSVLAFYKYDLAGEILKRVRELIQSDEAGQAAVRENGKAEGGSVPGKKRPIVPEPKPDPPDEERIQNDIQNSVIGLMQAVRLQSPEEYLMPSGMSISEKTLKAEDLPSKAFRDPGAESSTVPLWQEALKRVTFGEYLLEYFEQFCTVSDDDELDYEVEYILFGSAADRSNLTSAFLRILAIREGVNVLHITTSEKMDTVKEEAEKLVGWTEDESVIRGTEALLVGAWAFAESVLDVRALLQRKRIAILKSEETWALEYEKIPSVISGGGVAAKEVENGIRYEDYLRMFLYLSDPRDLSYRAMDLIQVKMQRRSPGFLMAAEWYAGEFAVTFQAKPLFTAFALFENFPDFGLKYHWRKYFSEAY